jgi:hypothetical protein
MFCTKCKSQFIEGIEMCPDCKIRLVEGSFAKEDMERTPQYQELITIAVTSNYFLVPLVKSILDSEGISYFIKGEHLLNMPRFMIPMEIQVAEEDLDSAKELLKNIDL